MGLYIFIVALILIVCVLLAIIVLVQNSKGGGLAANFSAPNQIMGVRKTTDFIEKLTWGLAAFMVVMSVAISYVIPTAKTEHSVIMEQAVKEGLANPLNAPVGFEAPAAAPAAETPVTETPAADAPVENN